MSGDDPREMWGSDEDRFRNIEAQIEDLASNVAAFTEVAYQLLERMNAAVGAEVDPDPETMRPQNAQERQRHFQALAREWATREEGAFIWSRDQVDLKVLASFLEVQTPTLMRIWNADADPDRVPSEWFERLEEAVELARG